MSIDNFDSVENTPVVRPETPLLTPQQVMTTRDSTYSSIPPIQQLETPNKAEDSPDDAENLNVKLILTDKTERAICLEHSLLEELSAQQMKTEEDEILTPIETPDDLPIDNDIWDDDEPFVEDDYYENDQVQDGAQWSQESAAAFGMVTPVRSANDQLNLAMANLQNMVSMQTDFLISDD